MSVILESLLDDERRAECRANDGAMAMGRPIIASQPTNHRARRSAGDRASQQHLATKRSNPNRLTFQAWQAA